MEYEEEENENEEEGLFGSSNGPNQANKILRGHLSCRNALKKRIQVTKILYGAASHGGCQTQNHQCEEEVDYDEGIMPICDGQMVCRIQLRPKQLQACRGTSNYVGVEYRCVDEWSLFNICQETSRVVYDPAIYITSPSYDQAQWRPAMSPMCECILQPLNHSSLLLESLQTHLRASQPNCTKEHLLIEAKGMTEKKVSTEIKVCESQRLTRRTLNGSTRITFTSDKIDISDGFIGKFSIPAPARMLALSVECGPVYLGGIESTKVTQPRQGLQMESGLPIPTTSADFMRPPIDFIGHSSRTPQPGIDSRQDLRTGSNSKVQTDPSTFTRPPQTKWPDSRSSVRRDPGASTSQRTDNRLRSNRNQTTLKPRIPPTFFNQLNQLPIDTSIRESLLNAIMESPLPELDTDNFLPALMASDPSMGGALLSGLPSNPRQQFRTTGGSNPRSRDIGIQPSRPNGQSHIQDPRSRNSATQPFGANMPSDVSDPRIKKIATPLTRANRPSGVSDPRNGNTVTQPSGANPRSSKIAPPPTRVPTSPPAPAVAPTNSTATNNGPVSNAIIDKAGLQTTADVPPGLSKNLKVKSEGPTQPGDETTGHTVGYVMGAVGLMLITISTIIIYVMWRRRVQRTSLGNAESGSTGNLREVPPPNNSTEDEPIYNTLTDIASTVSLEATIPEDTCTHSSQPAIMVEHHLVRREELGNREDKEAFVYNGPESSMVSEVCSRRNPRDSDPIYDNNIVKS
ncbi:hypothetical protein ScPMuIL_012388 [Solemya velum]